MGWFRKRITALLLVLSVIIVVLPYNASAETRGHIKSNISGLDPAYTALSPGYNVTVAQSAYDVIPYTTAEDEKIKFKSNDFNKICLKETGKNLSYVKFTLPSTSYGTLYYDYKSSSSYDSKVSSGKKYYRSSAPDLDEVTLVPASEYSGVFTMDYTAFDTAGESFEGKIRITVESSYDVKPIIYTGYEDEGIRFDADDFNDASLEGTGKALSYVKFSLPSKTNGRLYLDYVSSSDFDSAVSSSAKYYRNDTPNLDKVAFVPVGGKGGNTSISYTGYNVDGDEFAGKITVYVIATDTDNINYTTIRGQEVKLESSDFNNASLDATGGNLSYVKFTLPDSAYGRLYYDYNSDSDYDSAVSSSIKYYRSGDPKIDDITFVPYKNFTGTVTVSYSGYNTSDQYFTGKVKITVSAREADSVISYETKGNTPVMMDSIDFIRASEDVTGESLSYVKFTLPSKDQGKLYYDYTKATDYDSVVSSSKKYYKSSSPYLSSVVFVPEKDYSGTVSIKFTGYNDSERYFAGTVNIIVKPEKETGVKPEQEIYDPEKDGSLYFTDVTSNYSWAIPSIDHLYNEGIIKGTDNKKFSPSANITRGDFMLMLYRAMELPSAGKKTNFTDVPKNSYYYDAIAAGEEYGIALGSQGYFRPEQAVSREDAMVMVFRGINAAGGKLKVGNMNDLKNFDDRKTVSSYAEGAVAALVKKGIIKGDAGNIYPKGKITRAEMAVILFRILEEQ